MLTNKAVAIVDPNIKLFVQSYQFDIDRVVSPLMFTNTAVASVDPDIK